MTDAGPEYDYTAAGVGAEHFDAPAVFYLAHADAIERWHELRHPARAATSAFLDTIPDDLELPAIAPTWSVVDADTASNYRHHLISPDSCPLAADGTPAIAACFGWRASHVSISPGTYTPFVGVRIGAGKPESADWRQEFLRGTGSQALDIRGSRGYRPAGEWPAWKQVTAAGPWWQSLDAYRETVLAAIGTCIEDFAGEIERTVAAKTSP